MTALRDEIKKVCVEYQIVYGDNDEMGTAWVAKVLQLYQVSHLSAFVVSVFARKFVILEGQPHFHP